MERQRFYPGKLILWEVAEKVKDYSKNLFYACREHVFLSQAEISDSQHQFVYRRQRDVGNSLADSTFFGNQ